jgi:transcriptional regulator with XRE-family HTH domain
MIGYSARLIKQNAAADQSMLGVRLGKLCIEKDISVARIADHFDMTKQTVYNWFTGISSPNRWLAPTIEAFIEKYK